GGEGGGAEPVRVVERALPRRRWCGMERYRPPAREALEGLEVVTLSRHRLQEIQHQEGRNARASALRIHPRVREDHTARPGTDCKGEPSPLEGPRLLRD